MEVKGFQELMRQIYFHRDSKRGAYGTFLWLLEEVAELGKAIPQNDRKNLEDEFADVLAWLCSLANVLNIDLEKAALAKYAGKCPKCGFKVCRCPEA
ncbi:MAG: nucleotide pyrophosphohydrolase [Candidatus Hecatellales archaeon B24]|nr:MAG: nucleotide pyrophosphohydrolase [Candidatus Hecatellales archaeon B24]